MTTGTYVFSSGNTKVSFMIQSASGMAPTARLLVYCTKQGGEIVVDTLNVKIDDPFYNQVRMVFLFSLGWMQEALLLWKLVC